ncbi:type-1 angiotensin II receptor-like isoform X2 [Periplaneta americana]
MGPIFRLGQDARISLSFNSNLTTPVIKSNDVEVMQITEGRGKMDGSKHRPISYPNKASVAFSSKDKEEEEYENIMELDSRIQALEKEAESLVSEILSSGNQSEELIAVNKTQECLDMLSELVRRSHLLRKLMEIQNETSYKEFDSSHTKKYEETWERMQNTTSFIAKIDSVINLIHTFEKDNTSLAMEIEEYNNSLQLKPLISIVEKCREGISLLKNIIRAMLHLESSWGPELHFESNLLDLNHWNIEVNNYEECLSHYEGLLESRNMRFVIQIAIDSVVLFIGIVGNSVLLIVFIKHKEMLTSPNLMVLNLNVADFLSLLMNIFLYDLVLIQGSWEYGLGMCRVYTLLGNMSFYASVYTIVVINVQRCIVLTCMPKLRGLNCSLFGTLQSVVSLVSVWVVSVMLSIYPTFNATLSYDGCVNGAANDDTFDRNMSLTNLMTCFIIPFITIVISSSATTCMIKKSVRDLPGEGVGLEKLKRARTVSTNVLIALSVVFAFSYVPYTVFSFLATWISLQTEDSVLEIIYSVTFTLTFMNACFNPIAVFVASKKFRKYMKKYLFCGRFTNIEQVNLNTSTSTLESRL